MANTVFTFGLRPLEEFSGSLRTFEFIVTTGATIYRGDPVEMAATGTVARIANGAASPQLIGVAVETVNDSASAGGKKINIVMDPHALFVMNMKSKTANAANEFALADIGLNASIDGLAAFDATLGLSGAYIDADTKALTATFPVRILGLYSTPDNAVGANAKVIVALNTHTLKAETGI